MNAIGLVSPGEMGAAIGARLVERGERVRWASDGRGSATAARAQRAGVEDAGTLGELASGCQLLLSVVPPQFARRVAQDAAAAGFRGLYVDANAIAPSTATTVRAVVEQAGAQYVDGGIIGPPPGPSPTRLYLSGELAEQVAARLRSPLIETSVVAGGPAAASALKLAYAAWTKGSAALLLAAAALARRQGVADALSAEWQHSQPGLGGRLQRAARSAVEKGWRWAPEMEEIAVTMERSGLPSGFPAAAADLFRRSHRDADPADLGALLDALTGER